MKLELDKHELKAFLQELQFSAYATYTTQQEAKLSGIILKEFVLGLMNKCMKQKDKYKIPIDDLELLVLNHVLPQINNKETDIYTEMVMSDIYFKINQACLNI